MYYCSYQSPLGEIALTANDNGLSALAFQNGKSPITFEGLTQAPEKFTETIEQLRQYFNGERQRFTLALAPDGTAFQKQVWHALTKIPCGETKSYGWIAKSINNEKAVRAVGAANGANPIALIVPCHRVIGSNGKLTGYAGGLALKAKLLMHEGAQFKV
ncbi:MAG: methylated-DNA--[protein]-cysteine S-methyltransferase [Cognaticolwellia sp.]